MSGNFGEQFETYMLGVIEGREKGYKPGMLRFILKQLSRLFGGIVRLRLGLYNSGVMRSQMLGVQVISVGNLTVGGTGKTPVVEILARKLEQKGRKVAILSRGYKREKPSFRVRMSRRLQGKPVLDGPIVVAADNRLHRDSSISGDEPFMLASNLENVAVLVDKDRVRAGRYAIEKLDCDTLILDDGFQYLRLHKRLNIVLVDRTNPFGHENLLPRGLLREPKKNIKRANFIFITKSDGKGTDTLKNELRSLNPDAQISECTHAPRYLMDVHTRKKIPLDYLKGLQVLAVSGIAVPQGFEDVLVRLGAGVVSHRIFTDHHRYTQQEIIDIINEGLDKKVDAIVTTEKDSVRFPRLERYDLPVYFLRVEIEMISGSEAFDEFIDDKIIFRTPE